MQLLNYLSWQSTWHFQNRKVTAVLFSDNRFPSPIGHNADKALWYIVVSFFFEDQELDRIQKKRKIKESAVRSSKTRLIFHFIVLPSTLLSALSRINSKKML